MISETNPEVLAEAQKFNIPEKLESGPETNDELILEYLYSTGVFERAEDDALLVNPEQIKEVWKKKSSDVVRNSSDQDLIRVLQSLRGVLKQDWDQSDDKKRLRSQPVLVLPRDIQSLTGEYPRQAQEALINVWDLKKGVSWDQEINLPSGEKVSVGEMFMATKLKELQARRDENGRLLIYDPEKQKMVLFSGTNFDRLVQVRIGVKKGDDHVSFRSNPALFVERYLPNLDKLGLLKKEDLRTQLGSQSLEIVGMSEKRLNPKAPMVTIPGNQLSARYYLGRERIVGTDREINPQTMTVEKLDLQTAAIVERVHGRKRVLYTIDLLSDVEIAQKRKLVEEEYSHRGESLSPAGITSRVVVSGPEITKRINQYDITNFIPKRVDETAEQYAKRIANLNDSEFVLGTFRKFFSDAGIGVQSLPWSEQLILANAIIEEPDRGRLVRFAKQFGVEGVRTFLSLDNNPKAMNNIIKFGEKQPEQAPSIYKKYNEIIDAGNHSMQLLVGVGNSARLRIKENLFRKASELLMSWTGQLDENNEHKAFQELDRIKTEVLLFGAVLKSIRKEGGGINMEELEGVSLEIVEGLQPEDIPQMRAIYARNYNHVPEFQAELLAQFDRDVSPEHGYGHKDEGSTYYLLKVDGEIQAFNRFVTIGEERETGRTYRDFGWFNVNPDYQGFQIGEAMMERSLDTEAQSNGILATCTATDVIAQRYVSRGFIGYKFVADYKGIPDLYIERNDQKNRKYKSKFIAQEEIINRVAGQSEAEYLVEGNLIKIEVVAKPEDVPFDLTNHGWILTQYFTRADKYYAVFEELPNSDNEDGVVY